MTWTDSYTIIVISVAGGVFSILGLVVRAIVKSSCKEFSCCCGVVACVRDSSSVGPNMDTDVGDDAHRDVEKEPRTSEIKVHALQPITKLKKPSSFTNLWMIV